MDNRECCSQCKRKRWLCDFRNCHMKSTGHIPVYKNGVFSEKNERKIHCTKKKKMESFMTWSVEEQQQVI